MLNQIEAKIAVDLSVLNIGIVECDGKLLFDRDDQPVEIDLSLTSFGMEVRSQILSGNNDECLGGASLTMRLSDNRELKATLEIITNINTNSSGELFARCLISKVHSARQDQCLEGSWRFNLTNVKLRFYDNTDNPSPLGTPTHQQGWRRDRIAFNVAGRNWVLNDEMFGKWKQQNFNIHVPIISATLTTQFEPDDTAERVGKIADGIAAILTLALGRSIRAVKIEHFDNANNSVWWSVRDLLAFPFSQSGFPPIDNWQFETVKTFVESAYPIFIADREWWTTTLEMFMQVHINPYIQTKAMILNVLADRIATKLGVEQKDAEIDAQLNTKLRAADFKSSLHELLTRLSTEWTQERTNNLISTIKMWNAKPSFPESIRRACGAVRLKPPPTKLLGTRHQLMHVGELHPSDMTLVDYWKELEALVLLLILRMLDYDGFVYAAKFGAREILLKDYLEPSMTDGQA